MGNIRVFDTQAAAKVDFRPLKPGEFSLYYCGPTVYNYVHLGNLRPVVVFDILTRLFRAEGYKTKVVSNYTDIDDKIIAEALAEHKTEKEISGFYIAAYEDSLSKLNLLPLFRRPRASEVIDKMKDFIKTLLDKGAAYKSGGDVYFRTSAVSDYGVMSHMAVEQNQAGKRIDVSDLKENPADFALWKKTADEGIKFASPFGEGRPGWHTECVVMIKDSFGQPMVDIHGGGFDLKFPHHENERAQSLAYDGTPLASYWMHVGFLTAEGGVKMSKSLGNVVLAKDCLAKYSGNALRLFFSQNHYRAPVAYSEDAMSKAEADASRYVATMDKLALRAAWLKIPLADAESDPASFGKAVGFLEDDLNIANALTVLDAEQKRALTVLRPMHPKPEELRRSYATLSTLYDLIGISVPARTLSDEDRKALDGFEKARAAKDYVSSDAIRTRLLEKGIL